MERNRLYIHFIDDEFDILNLMRLHFRKAIKKGIVEFSFTTDVQETINFVNSIEHGRLVIISDVNMPEMSGLELIGELKKRAKTETLYYLLSAYNRDDYIAEGKRIGVRRYFKKPIEIETIKNALIDDLSDVGFILEL